MREFVTQTELGRLFGATSHVIGKWLVECGLRTETRKPSRTAFKGGFVEQAPSGRNGGYFYVWHQEKAIAALRSAGHRLKRQYEPPTDSRLRGPFEARKSSRNGYEIVGGDGDVGMWGTGQTNAESVVLLLNLAYQHGKFN